METNIGNAPAGAESWVANIPNISVDTITDPISAPYAESLTAATAMSTNGSRDMRVDSAVVTATNQVIEARKAAPGGELHKGVMVNLVEMLANTPGAIDSLKALQNGNAK